MQVLKELVHVQPCSSSSAMHSNLILLTLEQSLQDKMYMYMCVHTSIDIHMHAIPDVMDIQLDRLLYCQKVIRTKG